MSWYKPKKNTEPRTTLTDYCRSRCYWKKLVDREASDLYYKEYRRELYLDKYLVSLRYKKPRATWGWLDY